MMRLLPQLAAAGLLLLLAPHGTRAADPGGLHWHWKQGQVHNYLLKDQEVRTVQVVGQKFVTTTTMGCDWQWTVQAVDEEGTATLELKLKGLRVTSHGQDFDFQYDSSQANQSDDDFKAKLIDLYDQLRLSTYRLSVQRDGRIAEVYGFDKLLGEVAPGTNVADFYALNLHDGSFAWYLQLLLGSLPEKALAPGAKWTLPVQTTLAGFGQLSGADEVTLGGTVPCAERSCQELKLSGAQAVELDMTWANNPLHGTLKTTRLESTVHFDPRAGAVHDSTAQADYGGDLKLGANARPLVLKVRFEHTLELRAKP